MKVSSHLVCFKVLNWKMMMKSRTKNVKLWIIVGMCAKAPVTKHFVEYWIIKKLLFMLHGD